MEEYVNKDVCAERHKAVDERSTRNSSDIEDLDNRTSQIEKLTIRMGQIIDTDHEQITDHDKRIVALEEKPAKRWDTVVNQIIILVIGVIGGGLIMSLLK